MATHWREKVGGCIHGEIEFKCGKAVVCVTGYADYWWWYVCSCTMTVLRTYMCYYTQFMYVSKYYSMYVVVYVSILSFVWYYMYI